MVKPSDEARRPVLKSFEPREQYSVTIPWSFGSRYGLDASILPCSGLKIAVGNVTLMFGGDAGWSPRIGITRTETRDSSREGNAPPPATTWANVEPYDKGYWGLSLVRDGDVYKVTLGSKQVLLARYEKLPDPESITITSSCQFGLDSLRVEGLPPRPSSAVSPQPAPSASAHPTTSTGAPASAPASSPPPAPAVAPSAASPAADVLAFLVELNQALRNRNAAFLKERVKFPLEYSYLVYDMELHNRTRTVLSPKELIQHSDEVAPTEEFLKQVTARGPMLLGGQEDCESNDGGIQWDRGQRAVTVTGDSATVQFIGDACGATAYRQSYTLKRTGAGWILVGATR